MNVLKIILSFFLVSGLSYATPEVIASNAVVYKTIGNVALIKSVIVTLSGIIVRTVDII